MNITYCLILQLAHKMGFVTWVGTISLILQDCGFREGVTF